MMTEEPDTPDTQDALVEAMAQVIYRYVGDNDSRDIARALLSLINAHTAAAVAANTERCAKVADAEAAGRQAQQFAVAKNKGPRGEARDYESMAIAAIHIATAIRKDAP
jgi:hypothetical protein